MNQLLNHYISCNRWIIWISLLIALIVQIMPWPEMIYLFKPSFFLLILVFWVLTFPHVVNIGTGFLIGEIVDFINGGTLGVHAFALSIITYLIIIKFHIFRNLSLLKQIFIIIVFSIVMDLIILFEEILVSHDSFRADIFYNCISNGISWPLVFLLMKKINHNFTIR